MRWILVISALFLALNLKGQTGPCVDVLPEWDYTPVRTMRSHIWRSVGVVAWNIAASTAGAIGDGIRDDGNPWGWALGGLEAGMHISAHWVHNLRGWEEHLAYYASAAFIRAGTFDITYNVTRGLPWYYTGSTKTWDRAWEALDPPPHGKGWFYGWSFTLGVVIPFKHLR